MGKLGKHSRFWVYDPNDPEDVEVGKKLKELRDAQMPDTKLMTEKQGREIIEQNGEIIRRLGVLIALLAPRKPGSDVTIDTQRLDAIYKQVDGIVASIDSKYVR